MSIRVGIVGCGAVVGYFYARQLPRIPGVRVEAVSDLDAPRAATVAAEFSCEAVSFDDLVERVDLVIVATPPGSHRPLAEKALRRGRSVWVEKPFVARRQDAVELVDQARVAGAQLYVGHFRRLFPPVRLMREILQTGVLGPVQRLLMFEGGRLRWQSSSDYVSRDPLGGVLLDTGSHTLDVGLFASGLDRAELTCRVERVERDRPEPAHQVDASFVLESETGPIGCRLMVSRFDTLANKVRIVCEHGWIECGLAPGGTVRIGGAGGATVMKPKEEILGDQECFRRQCEAILLDRSSDLLGGHLFINQITILESLLNHVQSAR